MKNRKSKRRNRLVGILQLDRDISCEEHAELVKALQQVNTGKFLVLSQDMKFILLGKKQFRFLSNPLTAKNKKQCRHSQTQQYKRA